MYAGGIVIFSRNADGHILHVHAVQSLLHKAGVILNIKKCNSFTENIDYLEHVILPGKL